jgi:hypothetical protein
MLPDLKDIQQTYVSIKNKLDKGKESIEEMLLLLNFVKTIHDTPNFHSTSAENAMPKEMREFFEEEFTPGLLRRLSKERSHDENYLQVIADIMETYMLLFIDFMKVRHFNEDFVSSMRYVFNFDSLLNNFNYQIPEKEMRMLTSANQGWRNEIVEGQSIDALVYIRENSMCSGWVLGKVVKIKDDILFVEFHTLETSYDKTYDRWSIDIAEPLTKSKELTEWKNGL